MKVIKTLAELEQYRAHVSEQKIGLVPTMGNLHAGHLQLVKQIQSEVDRVVVSIFVNPTQFAADEDFDSYPRTLAEDCQALEALQVDAVFAPSAQEMYPSPAQLQMDCPALSQFLCGSSRPTHFAGVALVVTKLFNLVKPNVAIFGEKDYQQLCVIRQLVRDLNFSIRILAAPIVREGDGLAMSSRNRYLSPEERARAPVLYQTLQTIKQACEQDMTTAYNQLTQAADFLQQQGFVVDYLELRRQQDLQPATEDDNALIVLVAATLGRTRLLDNISIDSDFTT